MFIQLDDTNDVGVNELYVKYGSPPTRSGYDARHRTDQVVCLAIGCPHPPADRVVEIPGTMMRMSEEKGAATGMFEGFFIGAVNTVIRAVVGVYEVGTFPFPIPAEYKPILDDPQFMST